MSEFEDIAAELGGAVVLAFIQRPDALGIEYDLSGTDDMDHAIAIAAKGLITMLLDAVGFWEPPEEEPESDDDE